MLPSAIILDKATLSAPAVVNGNMRMFCIPRKLPLACTLSPDMRVPNWYGKLIANDVFTVSPSVGLTFGSSSEHPVIPAAAKATAMQKYLLIIFFIKT